MKKRHLLFAIPLAYFGACSSNSNSQSDQTETTQIVEPKPPVDEDELMIRLSIDLVAEPTTQAEIDQNAIINHAIDNTLDFQRTDSGIYYQIITPGTGDLIQWGDRIKVHYKGYFLNGSVFDSSIKRDKPLTFYVGNMVDGWNEMLQLLNVGSKATFILPSASGYGEEGLNDGKGNFLVAPNTILAFDIEVLEMVERKK